MFFWICFAIIFLPCLILFPAKIIGKQNLNKLKGKNYILACNHMSNFDPFMLDLKFHKKYRILAKKELFENKLKGFIFKAFGGIPIDRKNVDITAIKTVLKQLNKKRNICIFPQGTREKQPQILDGQAKDGVALFSIRTNTPVLPVMITKKITMFRRTTFVVGEPIYPDMSRKKDKAYIEEFSNEIIAKMNNLLKGESAQ